MNRVQRIYGIWLLFVLTATFVDLVAIFNDFHLKTILYVNVVLMVANLFFAIWMMAKTWKGAKTDFVRRCGTIESEQ